MIKTCRDSFPNAKQVTDRFHVQKLANEAVQEIRVKHRWKAIDKENRAIKRAKKKGNNYQAKILGNGDTTKQLLARSRFLLFKHKSKWTSSQQERAEILFKLYPDIKQSYTLNMGLFDIYQNTKQKEIAYTKLAHWYREVEESGFKAFNSVIRTIQYHYISILNYFDNRSTNASAESFNSNIKAFRLQFRGVRDIPFFLFRIEKLFA